MMMDKEIIEAVREAILTADASGFGYDGMAESAYAIARAAIRNNVLEEKEITMNELKPCPFCPTKAGRDVFVREIPSGDYVVACRGCGCEGPDWPNKEAAIEGWNTRVPDPRIADLEVEREEYLALASKHLEAKIKAENKVDRLKAELELAEESLTASYLRGAHDARADKWRPIVTAPRDGSNVLSAWNGNAKLAYWRGKRWHALGDTNLMWLANQPTHWQPLPPAPKGE